MRKKSSDKLEMTVESRTDRLILVRDFVSDAARKFGFNDEVVSKIALAVDEACSNIIKHAYRFAVDKLIDIEILMRDGRFEVVITDDGLRFDPDLVELSNMKEYLKQYHQTGFGMYLMKSLMDEVEYTIKPGRKNEVRLIKFLQQ
ncbi:MAG: ATP-binding protein [Bacteroidota bacterium]